MSKDWEKYIVKLNKKLRGIIENIIYLLIKWDEAWLNIKELEWSKWIFRCRVWKIRIVYSKNAWKVKIINIWPRWDIYKK